MKSILFFINLIMAISTFQCTTIFIYLIKPGSDFQEKNLPSPPNYTDRESWAALPDQKDEVDFVPSKTDLTDQQSSAKADVFYVHPTTYLKSDGWNADVQSSLIVYGLSPLKLQASVFNGSAKIYAPRYRQATLYSFIDDSGNAEKAFKIAREDVEKAFDHYMKYYNKGRPFFLAGHSQGSMMLLNILQNRIEKNKYPNFIAAYLPGWAIQSKTFSKLKPCNSPTELHCFISWNSKKWGSELNDFSLAPERYVGGSCVNPLSWKNNEDVVEKDKHLGAVGIGFEAIDRNYVRAKCKDEMLWVDLPSDPNYESRRGNKKNYHIADYNLFYIDIRENIKLRLQTYLNRK
ncbi:DUF3089 domain-containing protein [Leptospira sp. GIMC2001]|uniref:DUF3089 domain-containing protein n=1 Tax=Leptospira sp. GIMC2001 TaxID=1513297 RepID=UPI00234AC424|nr:DUF3089 domain-containing protein [Leptospira sp. GIMC2001]WCL50172.1 DUF3089 domain-containing protein [Leptospira sp. GIMC2001]